MVFDPFLPSSRSRLNQSPNIDRIINDAKAALRDGNNNQAYHLGLDATRIAPDNVEGWLIRARTAVSVEEILFSLSQVHRLDPNNSIAKEYTYRALWRMLERDPFLAYLDETKDLYYVRSQEYLSLAIPKDRAEQDPFPVQQPAALASANRLLVLSILGLVVAGLGTLLFAPLTILAAFAAARAPIGKQNKLRAWIILLIALALLGPAILLGLLFFVHLQG